MPQEKIIIEFKSKGSPELIKALNNLAKAQKNVEKGLADTKVKFTALNPKMLQLHAALKQQGKDWTALGVSIKTGTAALMGNKKAITLVDARLKALTGTTSVASSASGLLNTRNKRLAATNGRLALSFATLRSQLLLLTFAMGMGGRQAIQMVKDFAKVEAMSVAFDTLSGGAGNAQKALTQLSNAAGGTMSRFDLLQASNNALILGVVKNSDEMNEMFKVAIKLGRAVGRTAKESVDSLVTGIGRQSRMMLDNIGIIMSAEKAYTSFAAELGVTVESLDDTERRQAFLNATMESAREKAALLGDDLQTMQERLEMVSASWDNLKVATGGFLTELVNLETSLPRVADNLNALTRAMDEHQAMTEKDKFVMKDMIADVLVNAIPAIRTWTSLLGINTDMFREMAESIDAADGELIEFNRVSEDTAKALAKLNEESAALNKEWDDLVKKVDDDLVRALKALIDEMERQELKVMSNRIKEITEALDKLYKAQLPVIGSYEDFVGVMAFKSLQDDKEHENIAKFIKEYPEMAKALGLVKDEMLFSEGQFEAMDKFQQGWSAINQTANMYFQSVQQGFAQEMQELKNSDAFKRKSTKAQQKDIDDLAATQKDAKEKAWKQQNALIQLGIIADTAGAIMGIWRDVPKFDFGSSAFALSLLVGGLGAAQLGIVRGQSMPKFATGGMIGGRRHSQGGTMIEAEQGEFVMSRSAVQSVGIENLNRMNEGGGGGSVTVNVSGNVLSQDFVEGELAENIKEAIRRGTDFGDFGIS